MLATSVAVQEVYPVSCNHFRISSLSDLQAKITNVSSDRQVFKQPFATIEETLLHLLLRPDAQDKNVLICGSFYLMANVRKALKYPHGKLDECDEDLLNSVTN